MIERVLKHATLRQVDGAWALVDEGGEYIRLLDAKSREDAEQQIAEILFLRHAGPQVDPSTEKTVPVRTTE